MDPITTSVAKAGLDATINSAKGFLSKLAGPAAEELGALLQDNVKLYRLKNQLRILKAAEVMLEKAGISPQAVPFRSLLPILEYSSLEDDDLLSRKWSALLANAASTKKNQSFHQSFPRILADVSPREAAFLDLLYSEGGHVDWEEFRVRFSMLHNITIHEVDTYHGNLFRLGLCRIAALKPSGISQLQIGPFGLSFIEACLPPKNNT